MKRTPLHFIFFLSLFSILPVFIAANVCFAQKGEVVASGPALQVFSFHGTWEKARNPARAQFGGNNKLLQAVFNEFFRKMRMWPGANEKAELVFKIDTAGRVDTIRFIKRFESVELSLTVLKAIEYTSGKWKPGVIDGKKIEEEIHVNFQFYFNWNKQTLDGLQGKAQQRFDDGDYAKALKSLNEILEYDAYNVKASVLKGKCHLKLNEQSEACSLWNAMRKFEYPEIEALVLDNCK
jgi:tetratricopeptide (TPR) repeat protein